MSRSASWAVGFLTTLTLFSVLPAMRAGALPRYAARYEQNCALCHVNPGGGGMRSTYATQDLVPREFAMSPAAPESLAWLDPRIGKNLTIGADFRELLVLSTENSNATPQGFFPMQGNIYLAFQLDPRYLLYFDHGLANTYEFFGLAHVLPWDGYVKAGRFVPPYGWKFDDHTMYVRNDLGYAPPGNTDGGVEVGFSPRHTELQVALVNGNRGSTLDDDRRLATSVNLSRRFKRGGMSGSAGLAGYSRPGLREDLNTAGLFGYLTGWNVTWVGEGDLVRRDPAPGPAVTELVASHELSVLLQQGVELKGTYDFYDPDRRRRTGARSRWGIGAALMPRPFLGLELSFRFTDVQPGSALSGRDFNEGLLQLHLLY